MTDPTSGVTLADLTTLRVGGPASRVVEPADEASLIEAVSACDATGEPVLLVGGGSNLLVSDVGFDGAVIRLNALRGIATEDVMACSGAFLRVAAGEPWDNVVAHCVANGFVGVEALSGIPGLAGATPIQNVGAYGQEVSHAIARVRTYDRVERKVRTFSVAECGFGYRYSRFKADPGRWLVLSISLQLRLGADSAPIRYAELARRLGVEPGSRAPLAETRRAVIDLRKAKGMVLDASDHDTWSAGSFFTNPFLSAEQAAALPPDAPRYPTGERVKSSAAWLIEHAGFGKGYGTPPATLSTKHTLALTNRGGARAADILSLAREIRDGVETAFGVRLVPEPFLVGCSLEP
ncbi:MAG: UDP-N-acetylmuramate dehydrogenase [Propionicimonas sp.]